MGKFRGVEAPVAVGAMQASVRSPLRGGGGGLFSG